jgi:hypothetical protein
LTATFNLRAPNNATFHWTRDLSQWAAVYNLASATIRMQARLSPYAADPPAYQWVSSAASGGIAAFNPATGLVVFTAPLADMAKMAGTFSYDCRLEWPDGSKAILFGGRLVFQQGVTKIAGDLTALGAQVGDTVSVDGETASTAAVLPVSAASVLSQALAAAQTPALLLAMLPSAFADLMTAWMASLPTSVPAGNGAFWNNGGILAQTSGGSAPAMPAPLSASLFGAAMTAWAASLPIAAPFGAPGWWNDGGSPAFAAPSAAACAALSTILAAAPFNFGAAFGAWFASLPTSLPASAGQFWNNGGILSQS